MINGKKMKDLRIQHASVLLRGQTLSDQSVIIHEGRIISVSPANAILTPGITTIDAGGRLLTPGLSDIQINGGFGFDFTLSPESIWEVGERLVRFGVTSFLPTIITAPIADIERALKVWKTRKPEKYSGAIPMGWHVEGPFLNPEKRGAHRGEYLRKPDLGLISDWSPKNGVRLVTLAPELPGAEELIKQLISNGVVVSMGHSNATAQQAELAFNWGAQAGTHLFNAMPVLHHREPGLTGELLTNEATFAGIIADGIHVDPRLVKLAFRAKGSDQLILITDAMQALGMRPGIYSLAGREVIVDFESARLRDGTLAGSILTLPEAVRNMVAFTGCTFNEAITMVSETPARLLGISSKGMIAVGQDADLVLWDKNLNVSMVIVSGEIVYNHSEK